MLQKIPECKGTRKAARRAVPAAGTDEVVTQGKLAISGIDEIEGHLSALALARAPQALIRLVAFSLGDDKKIALAAVKVFFELRLRTVRQGRRRRTG